MEPLLPIKEISRTPRISKEILEDVKIVAIYCQQYDAKKMKDFEAKMNRVDAPVSVLQVWNNSKEEHLDKRSQKSLGVHIPPGEISNGKFEEWLEERMAEKIEQRLEAHQNPNFC